MIKETMSNNTVYEPQKVVFKNYKETVRVSQATKISDLMSTNRKIESCINGKIYQQLIQAVDYPTRPKERWMAMNDQRKNEIVFEMGSNHAVFILSSIS